MENPAEPSDLTNRGYSGTASGTVQQTWLDVSFRSLRRALRRLGVDLDADPSVVDVADVKDVVVSAALRVLTNPDGVKAESGSVDDYTESRTYADETQDVYFTAAELSGLIPLPTAGNEWVGSVKYS
jgi:hypothetical protein